MITELNIKCIEYIIQHKAEYVRENQQDTIENLDQKYVTKNIGCMKCNVSFVQYKATYLSYYPIHGELGFSDEFSGCAFTIFSIGEKSYIGHMSMESSSEWDIELWNKFVTDAKIDKYVFFKPFEDKTKSIYESITTKANDPSLLNCIGIFCDGIFYSGIYDKKLKQIVFIQYRGCYEDHYSNQRNGNIIYDNTKNLYKI